MKFTIGTDTEVALHNGNHAVSAIGRIGGSKESPFWTDFGNIQEDNVLAEFAISVCETKEEFRERISRAKEYMRVFFREQGLDYQIKSLIEFPKQELEHPLAHVFGCTPDYNAWTGRKNKAPSRLGNFRSAGGHIHVGADSILKPSNKLEFIKYMDLYLGVPMLLLDSAPESIERRKYYGAAGAFRPKAYGVEYRTPSNFWIASDRTIDWVYDQVAKIVELQAQEPVYKGPAVADTINFGDFKTAEKLIKEYNLL